MFRNVVLSNCKICRSLNASGNVGNASASWSYTKRFLSVAKTETLYSDKDEEKILKIVNNCEMGTLERFKITKSRVKSLVRHRTNYGHFQNLTDLKLVEGFTERTARSFFDSVLSLGREEKVGVVEKEGSVEKVDDKPKSPRLKGQVLHPQLTDEVKQRVSTVVSLHVMTSSVSYASLDPRSGCLADWGVIDLDWPDDKKLNMCHIIEIAWSAVSRLPLGSIYVLESPPTSLRAGGGDPGNTKTLSVNLQRAQLIAAVSALLTARARSSGDHWAYSGDGDSGFQHVVYFLRPSLASRLFQTLVGNERVSCEETVTALFASEARFPAPLQRRYRALRDRERESVGHCCLVNLTFTRLCYHGAKLKDR